MASPGPVDEHPLVRVDRPVPLPGPGQVRVRVRACGVCRTDLHLVEGDLTPRRPGVVPGHEVVGVVDAMGDGCHRFELGERIGIAWLRQTCGSCRWCRRGAQNLCLAPRFTGWDDDGGYATAAVVDESYAYRLPEQFDDEHAAPLLCAGIIGYRALRRAQLPPGGYPAQLSRSLVLVKWWLLALPHVLVIAVISGGLGSGGGLAFLLALIAAGGLAFKGTYPSGLFDLVTGMERWRYRVLAYVALMTYEYPPFRLDMGGADPGSGPPPPVAPPDRTQELVQV